MTGAVEDAVALTERTHPDLVRDAARARPKAWGALAARGVRAFRERSGRAPTDAERRAIWAGLWRAVERARGSATGP